jgi:hypothetical protein
VGAVLPSRAPRPHPTTTGPTARSAAPRLYARSPDPSPNRTDSTSSTSGDTTDSAASSTSTGVPPELPGPSFRHVQPPAGTGGQSTSRTPGAHLGSGSYQVTAVSTGRWSCVLAPGPGRRFRVRARAMRGQLLLEPGRGRRQDASQPSRAGPRNARGRPCRHPPDSQPSPTPILKKCCCTRPPELDCAFEAICETCTFFQTSIEFRPTLQRQRDHATEHDQTHLADLSDRLLTRIDQQAS